MNRKKKILKHVRIVAFSILSTSLLLGMSPPYPAYAIEPVDAAAQVIGAEGGRIAAKEALNAALKMVRSKPAMSAATTITCVSCFPAAGLAASPALCIACGILIAKTIG